MSRYVELAAMLQQRIEDGLYAPGARLPSVRELSREYGVSISTVQQAYLQLEELRLVVPKAKSGYFVCMRPAASSLPSVSRPVQRPVEISQWDHVLNLMQIQPSADWVQLARGMPDVHESTLRPLQKIMAHVCRPSDLKALYYDSIYGFKPLREEISRLLIDAGCQLQADDLVSTSGCSEAISVALRVLCRPGDIVAVESPTFYGSMQALKALELKALEIPTDPVTGMSPEALALALEQWPIKTILVTPNCNNPLGYIMPDDNKKKILRLAQQYDISIIEDDIYGDLAYSWPRPLTIKSFDDDGRVLLCGSFSKSIAPGLRVGWIAPGRYLQQVVHMKYIGSGPTATPSQMAVAQFLAQGHYMLHVRRMRQRYQQNYKCISHWVELYFPEGVRISQPQGGFLLWIELPEEIDVLRLNRKLAELRIQVAAGSLFSAAGKYRNCLRLNYAFPMTTAVETAIRALGALIKEELTVMCTDLP